MTQCRNRCWIAGAVTGAVVMLWVWATAGIVTGVLLGLIAAGLLGGLLVWGVCEGRGTADENEALRATYWEPEAFTPSRRVVAAGGRVVSQHPLAEAKTPGLGDGAPLQTTTLQASRDPAVARLVEVPPPVAPAPPVETVQAPDATVALLATPSIASVIPVEPVVTPASTPATAPLATRGGPDAERAGQLVDETAGLDDEPAGTGRDAHPVAGDVAIGADRVATVTARRLDGADPSADVLTRIDGVGPMQARWLRDNGVEGLEDVAGWDDSDVSRFAGMMGRDGHRIRSEDWQGQAAALLASTVLAATGGQA